MSKDELRTKLGELYKAKKDDVSVFGFKTHFGGGKSTGFALVYDSAEAMKKFEPRYRLVRYGLATKVEKASRQQRTSIMHVAMIMCLRVHRQAAQEQDEGVPRYRQDQGWCEEGQEISGCTITMTTRVMVAGEWWSYCVRFAWHPAVTDRSLQQKASACTATKA